MKLTRYISLGLLTGAILFAGCNKKLDVTPGQSITPDQIKTADDVKAILFGTYNSMQHYNAFGERYMMMADLLAAPGQVAFVGTFIDYRQVYTKSQLATGTIMSGIWGRSYIIINGANNVLERLDLIAEDERESIEGEAKFARGIAYYELVNYFGAPYSAPTGPNADAVPIRLKPVANDTYHDDQDKQPRNSVTEVYDQVIKDLTDAVAKLPEENENFRATKYAAEAFLSRVYLAQGKYVQAATAANDVIENSGLALTPTFDKAFNNVGNSTEDIFAIQQTSQSNAGTSNNGLSTFYSANDQKPGGRGDARVDTAGYNALFDGADDRKDFVYAGSSIGGVDGIYPGKWKNFYRAIPVVRLAEMYLTRAEANLRSGAAQVGTATPLEDVNTIRERANAAPWTSVTADQAVQERFRELAFEGDWLWTKKRLKMNVGSRAYDDPKLVFPVPQRERDIDENITQNPGY
ncbi:RagB/SusD family nutrient uptake outer membrane protein [Chitinophaga agrisoli]|uniref:RagB/SusD family nutrient uptake outer membrane protein n=1 Tax=Chitinophaga agrisoli TaxID=2607653 RepID=A0A5B2W3Y9_9BACT|nr:RagB/SusD family nutrient uptake outer membrane protein [Chitinophaga agrisoli]KAA2245147.1 RagB/SusD family nutrient uptake outer membrane protein [Chitinophaga agrisoli]